MKQLVSAPHHRVMLAIDLEGSTTRTDTAKAELRNAMYAMLDKALRAGGITQVYRDRFIDRGDGVLTLIHPVDQVPKTILLNPVVPTLESLVRQHDARLPSHDVRLRVALHAGEVHYDQRGCFGEALDVTFRLLDAPAVKRELRQVMSPLVLVVSDDIYQTVIRHDYRGIDGKAFESRVAVHVAGQRHRGWIKVSGN